jgi:hypothetical protein
MAKRKPVVGETLYALNVGNAARRREQSLTPVEVVAVGRKYFRTKPEGLIHENTFYLSNWGQKTEYAEDTRLYESPQEWEDEKERHALIGKMRSVFDYRGEAYHLSLDSLRTIASMVAPTSTKGGEG